MDYYRLGVSSDTATPMHFHKCKCCGHVWMHSDSMGGSVAAHSCKQCGTEEWVKELDSSNQVIEIFVNRTKEI